MDRRRKDWARCETSTNVDSANVVLALAGRDDAAALVGATITDPPHIFVESSWQGTLPILEVEDQIREACESHSVLRVAMDPARWSRTLQVLEGLPVIEYPLTASRMIPASARFKEAVENQQLTHSGDETLAQAIGDTRTKTDDRGTRIVNGKPLAVAAVVAHDLACDPRGNAFRVW